MANSAFFADMFKFAVDNEEGPLTLTDDACETREVLEIVLPHCYNIPDLPLDRIQLDVLLSASYLAHKWGIQWGIARIRARFLEAEYVPSR